MKLSTRARYALRAMTVVAQETKDGNPVNLSVIAEKTRITRRYLEQVAITLKNAGLLKAVSGKNGGHMLTRPAADIKLGEIVEAGIGPINIVKCARNPESCLQADVCECRYLYSLVNQRIIDTFNSFTLADMAESRIKALALAQLESN